MIKELVLLALLFSCVSAIAPKVYEHKSLGQPFLPELLYSLSVDCENGTVHLIVMDANFTRMDNASTFLKYVDFSSPLISRMATGTEGTVAHQLPGNVSNMRGLFIMVMEKKGFRSKEIHFDILRCFGDQTYPPFPVKPVPNVSIAGNETQENASVQVPAVNLSENITQNMTNATTNQTAVEDEEQEECLPAFLLPLLLLGIMKVNV
jgi:hypothetical protein